MNDQYSTISMAGKSRTVRAIQVKDLTIIITGKLIRLAKIKDEPWLTGEVVGNPEIIIDQLKSARPRADIFNFSQKLPGLEPKYDFPFERYNMAAIPLASFTDWWENRLSQVTRKNVRRAARKGIEIRRVDLNDQLIEGIVNINDETPIRQGKAFWHYKKSFDTVKKDYSDFLDRSEFLGAFFNNELVGFIRIVHLGNIASILQLLCLNKHYDKRPANALIAKAVEYCIARGEKFLTYGHYVYSDNVDSPLTEFKRRNGFEKFSLPCYDVPLTLKGRIALKLHLHKGLKTWIPKGLLKLARKLRTTLLKKEKGGETIDRDAE